MKRKSQKPRAPAEPKPGVRGTANAGVQAQTRKVLRTHYAAKYRVR